MHDSVNDLFIEKNTILSSKIQIKSGRSKLMTTKDYRVLGLYEESYKKWFMYGQKTAWGDNMKTEDKKKYKILIRIIKEGVLTDFDDVDLTDSCYDLKEIYSIVNGIDIIAEKECTTKYGFRL